jgi:hypothetical protein
MPQGIGNNLLLLQEVKDPNQASRPSSGSVAFLKWIDYPGEIHQCIYQRPSGLDITRLSRWLQLKIDFQFKKKKKRSFRAGK